MIENKRLNSIDSFRAMPPKNSSIRCVNLLRLLTDRELRAFGKFMDSPLFKVGKQQHALLKYLLKSAPDYEEALLEKPVIHRKLFGAKTPYNEKTIRDLLSDLALLLEEFIAIERVRRDKVLRKQLLAEETTKHPDRVFLYRELTSLERAIDRKPNRSTAYYREKFRLQKIKTSHPLDDTLRNRRDALDEAAEALQRSVALEKARLLLQLKNRRKALGTPYSMTTEAATLDYLRENTADVACHLYLLLLENIDTPDLERTQQIFALYSERADAFSYKELIDISALAGNACTRLYKSHSAEAIELANRMNLFTLQSIFTRSEEATISPNRIRNIYGHAVHAGTASAIVDAIRAIYEERNFNSEEHLDNLNFILAHYNLSIGELDVAYQKIALVNLNNPDLGIHGRILQIRLYFELFDKDRDRYSALLESALDSYSKYIRRYDKSSLQHTVEKDTIASCLRDLYSVKKNRKGSKALLKQLETKVPQITSKVIRSWIERQIESVQT